MSRKHVLVTGMSGLIGTALRGRIDDKHDLSALNRRDVPGVRCHRADITDLDAIQPAFEGQDVVVHLAGVPRNQAGWDEILPHNVIGTQNVFEAARRAGVRRIVFASTNLVVGGWEREMPWRALVEGRYDEVAEPWPMLTAETPVRPTGWYACAKVFGEALARYHADAHGMSALCVRMGRVIDADRPQIAREFCVWCSQRDVAQILDRCIDAPDDLRFDIFYALSDNRRGFHDLTHAREVLGYEPEDAAEDWREQHPIRKPGMRGNG